MKKTKILMISCCMAICLAGCGTKSPEETGPHVESIPVDESAQTGERTVADEGTQSDDAISQ